MRILYFLAHPNVIGGASKQMIYHAFMMQKKGHVVRVVIQAEENGKYIEEFDEYCGLYNLEKTAKCFKVAICLEEIDIQAAIQDADEVKRIVNDFEPDIIHSLQLNVAVEFAARYYGVPHMMSIYQICEGMFEISWEKVTAEFHCADSEYYCRQWAEGLGIESRCVRVAYEPIYDIKSIRNPDQNAIEIVNIGIVEKRKQQLEICRFVNICKEKGIRVHVTFLGKNDSEYGKECLDYVRKAQLEDWISFEGFVLNIHEYMKRADLLIHASTSESYPGVIVEAMAYRVPVLCTPIAGIPELVVDGYNGFLMQGYECQCIFYGFDRYLHYLQNELIGIITDNAYKTYIDNHTFERVGNCLEEYYKSVLKDYEKNNANYKVEIKDKISSFWRKKSFDDCSDYTKQHIWYLYHVAMNLHSNMTCIIWGTGRYGSIGLEWSKILGLEIRGYIDSNRSGTYNGFPIKKPTVKLLKSVNIIIVSVMNFSAVQEIMSELNKAGFRRNKEYYLIHNDACY